MIGLSVVWCNAYGRAVSRGLGKIERLVLGALARGGGGGQDIDSLATLLVHDTVLERVGETCEGTHECCDEGWRVTRSDRETVARAVRSLSRKGLVDGSWSADVVVGERPYLVFRLTQAGRTAQLVPVVK